MAEIKEFKPSTKERPKPEKPADVVDIELARKKRQLREHVLKDKSAVLDDALDLIRTGQFSDAEIDSIDTISDNEKTLLKVMSGLFERLRKYDEEFEELRNSNKKLRQESEQKE